LIVGVAEHHTFSIEERTLLANPNHDTPKSGESKSVGGVKGEA
jgi:hypothetical protein